MADADKGKNCAGTKILPEGDLQLRNNISQNYFFSIS
jgi:hypothetical protein